MLAHASTDSPTLAPAHTLRLALQVASMHYLSAPAYTLVCTHLRPSALVCTCLISACLCSFLIVHNYFSLVLDLFAPVCTCLRLPTLVCTCLSFISATHFLARPLTFMHTNLKPGTRKHLADRTQAHPWAACDCALCDSVLSDMFTQD